MESTEATRIWIHEENEKLDMNNGSLGEDWPQPTGKTVIIRVIQSISI